MRTVNVLKILTSQAKITNVLILLNAGYFAVSRLLGFTTLTYMTDEQFLILWGADNAELTLFYHEYWRLFTSMFVHADLTHLVMNMLALWSVGPILEKRIPAFMYIGIYLFSGLFGNLISDFFLLYQHVVSCGASGAIIGVITSLLAYSVVFKTNFEEMPIKAILISLVLTAGLGLLPSINNIAHVAGAISGFIISFACFTCLQLAHYPSKLGMILLLTLLVIVAAIFVLLVYELTPYEELFYKYLELYHKNG